MRAKFSLTDTVFIVQVSVMNLRVIFARLYDNMLKEFVSRGV